MKRPKTQLKTLYRLIPEVGTSPEEMFDSFTQYADMDEQNARHADIQFPDRLGVPALWIGVQHDEKLAEWAKDAAVTTGLDLSSFTERRADGLLLLSVDGTGYALSYGKGYLLLPDALKDERFGLDFLIRRLDSSQVQDLVRRRPNARGRTDATTVAAGAPVWMLGVEENVEIIKRIGGRARDLKVTFTAGGDRGVNIEGSGGLRMPFGVAPDGFVADIRECARVCCDEQPDPTLEFIENIQPVGDADLKGILDDELDQVLAGTAAEAAERLVPVVPTPLLGSFGEAHRLKVSIGSCRLGPVPSLELGDILRAARSKRAGERVNALRNGRICLYADARGEQPLGGASADKWLEASISVDTRRFFLMDGKWYELGDEYVRRSRAAIEPLFTTAPSVTLPPWSLSRGCTEREYNQHVAARSCGQMLCLDRNQTVRNPLGIGSGLEICDLLGPHNELIHVKRAKGSAPLSHLFQQGVNSALSLTDGPASVRCQFLDSVASVQPHGRHLPRDFMPTKVVYAILLESGKALTPSTLFPFSQATLANAARLLHARNIAVEVIGIPAAP